MPATWPSGPSYNCFFCVRLKRFLRILLLCPLGEKSSEPCWVVEAKGVIMAAALTPVLLAAEPGLLKVLTVYLLSTFKFIGGPLAGISMGLPLYLTVLLTIAGMMTSVLVISYA